MLAPPTLRSLASMVGTQQALALDRPAGPGARPDAHGGGRPPTRPSARTARRVRLHRRWGRRRAHGGRQPRGHRGRGVRAADGGLRRGWRPRPHDHRARHTRIDAVAREPGGVHPDDGPRGRCCRGTRGGGGGHDLHAQLHVGPHHRGSGHGGVGPDLVPALLPRRSVRRRATRGAGARRRVRRPRGHARYPDNWQPRTRLPLRAVAPLDLGPQDRDEDGTAGGHASVVATRRRAGPVPPRSCKRHQPRGRRSHPERRARPSCTGCPRPLCGRTSPGCASSSAVR